MKLKPFSFSKSSSLDCNTCRGLSFDWYARSNLSNIIGIIGNSSFFFLKLFNIFSALLNRHSTSSCSVNWEPWKYTGITWGYFWKNLLFEYLPLIELFNNSTLKFFPLPGFPIIVRGIPVIIETNIENIFSFNKEFLAIPFSNSIWSRINSCSIFKNSKPLFILPSSVL